jgi:hypothetical protein
LVIPARGNFQKNKTRLLLHNDAASVAQVCNLRESAKDSGILDVYTDREFPPAPTQVTNLRYRMCEFDFFGGFRIQESPRLRPQSANRGEIPACGIFEEFMWRRVYRRNLSAECSPTVEFSREFTICRSSPRLGGKIPPVQNAIRGFWKAPAQE